MWRVVFLFSPGMDNINFLSGNFPSFFVGCCWDGLVLVSFSFSPPDGFFPLALVYCFRCWSILLSGLLTIAGVGFLAGGALTIGGPSGEQMEGAPKSPKSSLMVLARGFGLHCPCFFDFI